MLKKEKLATEEERNAKDLFDRTVDDRHQEFGDAKSLIEALKIENRDFKNVIEKMRIEHEEKVADLCNREAAAKKQVGTRFTISWLQEENPDTSSKTAGHGPPADRR
ncbi:unnamed protein product [Didymodactylos carnosus]|uniref:Uncharacterized protein n=1 Tax=Didymodactylos carnosus TaxID=1234261 RepID=A0A8S2YYA0_9BILA|nr:unnamed protein product [Didymodactylos carnosus]